MSNHEGINGGNEACCLEMRKSILGWNLAVAAGSTSSRNGNMRIIFEDINRLLAAIQDNANSFTNHTASRNREVRDKNIKGISARIDGGTPGCFTSPPSPSKNDPIGDVKPICYRITDSFCYDGNVLHKNFERAVKSAEAVVQPVFAEACPSKHTKPRNHGIRNALEYAFHSLYEKDPSVSATIPESRSTNIEEGHDRCGRFAKALHLTGHFSHKQKAKESGKYRKPVSKSIEDCSSKDPKPFRYWIRSTFRKAVNLFQGKKSEASSSPSKSGSVFVGNGTNVNLAASTGAIPRCGPQNPLLQDNAIKGHPSQGTVDLAKGGVEEVSDKMIRHLEGSLTTMPQEHRAFVEFAIRQGVQDLKAGVSNTDETIQARKTSLTTWPYLKRHLLPNSRPLPKLYLSHRSRLRRNNIRHHNLHYRPSPTKLRMANSVMISCSTCDKDFLPCGIRYIAGTAIFPFPLLLLSFAANQI